MSDIQEARAIAAFKMMGPGVGFLQPVFAAGHGDNQSYIQVLKQPARIDAFDTVVWPDRDCFMLEEEAPASVGDESIWGFQFEDGTPLVRKWSQFREEMLGRIADGQLAGRTLLQFDVVDTLDLTELKPRVYTEAFNRYLSLSSQAASNWRDRTLLEPALRDALRPFSSAFSDEFGSASAQSMRARIADRKVTVQVDRMENGIEDTLTGAFEKLKADYPEIFADTAELAVQARERSEPATPRRAQLVVVLVGRLAEGDIDRRRWADDGIEVIAVDHFHPRLRTGRGPNLTVFVGAESEWPDLVEAQRRMGDRETVIITVSTVAGSTMRDIEFQQVASRPTIKFFAPYATSSAHGRDPLSPLAPLIQALSDEAIQNPVAPTVVAEHSLFIREMMRGRQDATEFCCRLGARALRSGAVLGGPARIYSQGDEGDELHAAWARLLSPLFEIDYNDRGIRSTARRSTLLMLVERLSKQHMHHSQDMLRAGASRLLQMRGWKVVREDGEILTITDGQREFQAVVTHGKDSLPPEDAEEETPGLGRSRLLVIHTEPKREQLLIGNSGQYFHVALEDIALMEPQASWIWPVLQRQLLSNTRRPTLGALRLAAGLIAEAVKLGRVQTSFVDVDWEEVARLAAAKDCERFLEFHPRGIEKGTALVIAPKITLVDGLQQRPAVLKLAIEPDGPLVSAAVDFI